jgi:hypothetical protein
MLFSKAMPATKQGAGFNRMSHCGCAPVAAAAAAVRDIKAPAVLVCHGTGDVSLPTAMVSQQLCNCAVLSAAAAALIDGCRASAVVTLAVADRKGFLLHVFVRHSTLCMVNLSVMALRISACLQQW